MKAVVAMLALGCLVAASLTGCSNSQITSAKIYLYQQNNLEAAKQQLEEALRINPKDAEAHYLLGEVYSREKQFPEMLQEFDVALTVSQKHKADIEKTKERHFRELFNGAVDNFNNQKSDSAAIEQLKLAMLISPGDREGWSLLAKFYIRASRYDEAHVALQRAIALDPQFQSLDERILLMEMNYNNGKIPEALNNAEELLRKDSANKDAIRVAAFCYNNLAMQETDQTKRAALQTKALDYYQKVLQNTPDDPDLIFNLGLLYEAMERYDEAIAQFDRAYALNPKDLEAVLHSGQIYLNKKNDNQKAIEAYKKALEIDPNKAGIWNNLGIAQIRAGEKANDEALIKEGTASLKKAEELRGKNQ